LRSGSLITASQALEQNREVFAIPGSIHNPASRGCNNLLKQGAKLVEDVDDILEEFSGWNDRNHIAPSDHAVNSETNSPVYQALGYEPTDIDTLADNLGLPIADLLSLLSDLEVEGWVEQYRGAWQRSR
ncbi:DNA-processing protein DprA, partial [Zhongshania sp.]